MEREAFARAWRYLRYKAVAKWSAQVAAVLTALLFITFLILLLLFTDLLVNRGKIPTFKDLDPEEQNVVLSPWRLLPRDEYIAKDWTDLSQEDRQAQLVAVGVDPTSAGEVAGRGPAYLSDPEKEMVYRSYRQPKQREWAEHFKAIGLEDPAAQRLAAADVDRMTASGREVLWRSHVHDRLEQRVGPVAATVPTFSREPTDEDLADRGILSLVVRTGDQPVSGRLAGWLARMAPWTWQRTDPDHPNFYRYLTGLLLTALLVAVLRVASMFIMNYLAAVAVIEACNRLRRAVYHHTFRLGGLAFRAPGPNEAVSIFTRQIESVHDGLYAWLTVVNREPVKFFLLLFLALVLNFWLTLAFLFFAVLVWLIAGQMATYFRREEEAASKATAEQLSLLQESVVIARLVKMYLMELFNQSRVERQLAAHAEAQRRRYQGLAIYRPLLVFLGTLAGLVLLYVAGQAVLSNGLRLATGITLATALVSLYWPLATVLEQRRFLRRGREAALVVFKFLDRPGEVGQAIGAEFLGPMSRKLEFDKVSLKEPGTGRKVLENISFTVKAGQRVGFVGSDDQEKYALVFLLPRFLDPTSGEIKIDGKNLRWVTFESLRAQVAMVLQQNLIFNDTIANNIGCGDAGFTLPRIIEAAKVAHAHNFIQKLPQGYQTVIGEMGHTLSASEQFRIGLARAILRDPAVVVIEEPITPMDDDSKAMVDDTFSRFLPGRTVIFLPHRISTIRSCDQVYLLHNGQIEAEGEHRELLSTNQLYRHLQYMEFNEFAEQKQ